MGNRIYLAGPMRGHEFYNFPGFHYKAQELSINGWNVFDPARVDCITLGIVELYDQKKWQEVHELVVKHVAERDAFTRDIQFIINHADAVYMMAGWENSRGAQAEWAIARAIGLQCLYD